MPAAEPPNAQLHSRRRPTSVCEPVRPHALPPKNRQALGGKAAGVGVTEKMGSQGSGVGVGCGEADGEKGTGAQRPLGGAG